MLSTSIALEMITNWGEVNKLTNENENYVVNITTPVTV